MLGNKAVLAVYFFDHLVHSVQHYLNFLVSKLIINTVINLTIKLIFVSILTIFK